MLRLDASPVFAGSIHWRPVSIFLVILMASRVEESRFPCNADTWSVITSQIVYTPWVCCGVIATSHRLKECVAD
jgi:hypothetical protein